MFTLAGVDGCKGGWIAVVADRELRNVSVRKVTCVAELMSRVRTLSVVAVDIPIGLPDENQPRRQCDLMARNKLGPTLQPRVFFAPHRFLLGTASHPAAVQLSNLRLGQGMAPSIMAFCILPKIEEVDKVVLTMGQSVIKEVHPEISFWSMNGQEPIQESKHTEKGRKKRRALLEKLFTPETIDCCDASRYGTGAKLDDLYDALAALWSARRIASGQGKRLPERPQVDDLGLAMEINY